MRKYYSLIYYFTLTILLSSCEFVLVDVPVPNYDDSEIKKKLDDFTKSSIEGLYLCTSADRSFGDTVVFKTSSDYLSVFTGTNTAYMVMEAGSNSADLVFVGYWRHANSDKTGLVQFKILANDGGRDLLAGKVPTEILVKGNWTVTSNQNIVDLQFKRISGLRPVKPDYYILAHKGGGRNIDRLPNSENTTELMEYAERLGANGIETDVMLTKDNVPVMFHDSRLSLRTVNNEYLIGEIREYTYKQLEAIAPLKHGERIPTLDKALSTVLYKTNLKLVWLDVKAADAIPLIQQLQKKYNDKAIAMGRQLEIMIGIPDENVFGKVKKLADYQNVPTLCELDENHVDQLNSKIWAPRWSLGLLTDRVNAMHQKGKRVFIWTLDEPELIRTFIRDGDFDGIVTNYSPVVAYEYYTGKK